MNAREGIDLAKMAVACLLMCLVIGAGFTVWYLMENQESKFQDSMEKATVSSYMDRMWDFHNTSATALAENEYDDMPLVTNAANAISEFNEDSLLFVYIDEVHKNSSGTYSVYKNGHLYTYTGVTISNVSATFKTTPTVSNSEQPTTHSVKQLLKYSECRCFVEVAPVTYSNMEYTGIRISVFCD